jgi:hypothetical protein
MSVPISVLVYPTVNTPSSSSSGTGSASAVSDNTSGSMGIAGVYPPFNLFEAASSGLHWSGFQWPVLASGAAVQSIEPVVLYSGSFFDPDGAMGSLIVTDQDGGEPGFPSLPSSGTWVGGSIGTSQSSLTAYALNFSLAATLKLSNYSSSLFIQSISLRMTVLVPGTSIVEINVGNTKPLGS